MELIKEKIKKFFLGFNKLNKPAIFAGLLFCLFLGLLVPLQITQAQGLLGSILAIPLHFVNVILWLILTVCNAILALAGLILGWVVGPYFTTLPYTHSGIVEIGWPIVRDFINMFFVIILVVIGLATALRVKEYQAQKTLPILIIIAILINFTPVICGLIIDASNIVMNYFLEELTGFDMALNFFGMQGSILVDALSPGHVLDFRYTASAFGKIITMIVFDIVTAYIFLLYSLLFIMRYVMLWALVIISPIAFFSKILPGSQKTMFKSVLGWDEWWKEFIEWSLLGIVAGFFLYLAEQLMVLAPGMIGGLPPGQGTGGWIDNPVVDFVNNFLPWMVVLVFLWIGYKITKSTSAMGAQSSIKFVDKSLKALATGALAAATLGVGAAGAAGLIGKASAGAGRAATKMGKIPVLGKPLKYGIGKPLSLATRGVEMIATPPLRKYAAKVRRVNFNETFKDMEAGDIAEMILAMPTKQRRVAATAWMADKGILDKVPGKVVPDIDEKTGKPIMEIDEKTGEQKIKTKTINPFKEQMAREATNVAKDPYYRKSAGDVLKTLTGEMTEKASLQLETDPEARNKLEEEITQIAKEISQNDKLKVEIEIKAKEKGITIDQAGRDMAAREIFVKNFKAADVKDIDKMSFKDAGVRRGMRNWSSAHMGSLINNFKKDTIKGAFNNPGGLNTMFKDKTTEQSRQILEELYADNPLLVNFFMTNPAGVELDWGGREIIEKSAEEGGRGGYGGFENFRKEMTMEKIEEIKKKMEAKRKKEKAKQKVVSPKEEKKKKKKEKPKIPPGRRGPEGKPDIKKEAN